MKVTQTESNSFTPFSVTLTFESLSEVQFYAALLDDDREMQKIVNNEVESYPKFYPFHEMYSEDDVFGMTFDFWEILYNKLNNKQ